MQEEAAISTVLGNIYKYQRKQELEESDNINKQLHSVDTSDILSPKMIVDFMAGLLGGAAGVLVGHPLDTVKVHLQTDDPRNPKYRGTVHCFRTILAKEKIQGLYRGISSPMAGIAFVNAIVFGVYGNVQRITDDPNALASHFWAGSAAGLVQSIVCSPMELAKTRMQLSTQKGHGIKFKGPLDCLKVIIRQDGMRGVFKGLSSTAARDVPGFAGYFVSYEYLMSLTTKPNSFYTLMSGGIAGMCSWVVCYPIDVVKTSLQSDGLGKNAKFKGFTDCAIQNYYKDGIRFFFRGFSSTMIRAFPMNAACFYVVSWVLYLTDSKRVETVIHNNKPITVLSMDNNQYYFSYINNQIEDTLVRKKLISKAVPETQFQLHINDTIIENDEKEKFDYYLIENYVS